MIFEWFGVIMRWFYMILHDFAWFRMDFAWFCWEILGKSNNWPRRRFGWGRSGRGETQKFQKLSDPKKLTLDPSQIDFGEVWGPYVDFWPSEIPLFWQKRQNGTWPRPPPKMASKILQNPPKSCKINEKSPKISQNHLQITPNSQKKHSFTIWGGLWAIWDDFGRFLVDFSWFLMIFAWFSMISQRILPKTAWVAVLRGAIRPDRKLKNSKNHQNPKN